MFVFLYFSFFKPKILIIVTFLYAFVYYKLNIKDRGGLMLISAIIIILIVLIILIIISVAVRFIAMLFKIASVLFFIALIVLGFVGYSVYKDANSFQTNFYNSRSLFLLKDNNTIISGFVTNKGSVDYIDKIDVYSRLYNNSDFKTMLFDGFYKIFTVDSILISNSSVFFNETNKTIDF